MKLEIEINEGDVDWEDNAALKIIQPSKSSLLIEANKEGLISLAKQLLMVAYTKENIDIHYWPEQNTDNGYVYGDLEEGSLELSIMKIETNGRKKYK